MMEPVVRSLVLKGFRSLSNVKIDFDNPTFLVGRNGAGKSNIGDALKFLSEAMISPLREVIDRRGGISSVRTQAPGASRPRNVGLAIVIGFTEWRSLVRNPPSDVPPQAIESARYAFELRALKNYEFEILREQCVLYSSDGKMRWFDRRENTAKSNIDGLPGMKFLSGSALGMPVLGSVLPLESVQNTLSRMKVYSIEPSVLREMQDPESGTDLRADGRNAASVFEEIERRAPESITRIKEILSAIVPETLGVDTVQHGKKLAIEFTQQWAERKKLTFEAYSMSDGTLRALGLLLAVFQVHKPSLIFVDEPEASIHPGAAGAILDVLRHAASTMQVVISTQSPEILDAKWIESKHIRSVVWREGATNVEEIPESAKRALHDHLMGAGELLRSEAFDSQAFDSAAFQSGSDEQELNRRDVALFEDV